MASSVDCTFSVCEVLCCLKTYYGKVPDKQLKQIIHDFYDIDKVSEAKGLLINGIEALKLDKWPRPSRRRNSDNKSMMEVDDIFALWTFVSSEICC